MSCRRSLLLALLVALGASAAHADVVPVNDSPLDAEVLVGCNVVIQATTVGATNDVDQLNCSNTVGGTGYVQPYGGDVFYRVSLPSSYIGRVLVEPVGDWDVSVYLVTSPWNPDQTCVTGADHSGAGFAEELQFENAYSSGEAREFIIGIDSWRADHAGDFILNVTCDFAVPNEGPSLGTLKARFGAGER